MGFLMLAVVVISKTGARSGMAPGPSARTAHMKRHVKSQFVKTATAVGFLWLMVFSVSSFAMAMELDFNISSPTSGTISYGGGGGALIGSNIEVDNVVGLSTPANSNVISTCLSCVLNFTSGSLSGSGSGSWAFGPGGTISITGGVQLQGGTDIPLGSTLLSGTFNDASVQGLGGQGFKVTFGSFSDTKIPELLSFYGLTPGAPFQGALTLLFDAADNGAGTPFTSSSVFGGTVVNAPALVPAPAALLLFGSGLLGLIPAFRKKFSL